MIPSCSPPFAMTRWVAQTRQNYVSVCPYNNTDTHIHGFQGTHQPAIWMGESGQATITPGTGEVFTAFEQRGLPKKAEVSTASFYSVILEVEDGDIKAEMSSSRFASSIHRGAGALIPSSISGRSSPIHIQCIILPVYRCPSHSGIRAWIRRSYQYYFSSRNDLHLSFDR